MECSEGACLKSTCLQPRCSLLVRPTAEAIENREPRCRVCTGCSTVDTSGSGHPTKPAHAPQNPLSRPPLTSSSTKPESACSSGLCAVPRVSARRGGEKSSGSSVAGSGTRTTVPSCGCAGTCTSRLSRKSRAGEAGGQASPLAVPRSSCRSIFSTSSSACRKSGGGSQGSEDGGRGAAAAESL